MKETTMTTTRTAPFLIGLALLSTVTFSHADVFKCPNGTGGFTFGDLPCSVAGGTQVMIPTGPTTTYVPPARQAQPPTDGPLMRDEPQIERDNACREIGELAQLFAEGRDRGVHLSEGLRVLAETARRKAIPHADSSIFRKILIEIYAKSWWTPTVARQRAEVACVQGLEKS